jgi:hypothetical protein
MFALLRDDDCGASARHTLRPLWAMKGLQEIQVWAKHFLLYFNK